MTIKGKYGRYFSYHILVPNYRTHPFKHTVKQFCNLQIVLLSPFILDLTGTLTHCRLNRLSHNIYWKSPISILGKSAYEILIFLKKNG